MLLTKWIYKHELQDLTLEGFNKKKAGKSHVCIKIVTEYLRMFLKALRNCITYIYQKLPHTQNLKWRLCYLGWQCPPQPSARDENILSSWWNKKPLSKRLLKMWALKMSLIIEIEGKWKTRHTYDKGLRIFELHLTCRAPSWRLASIVPESDMEATKGEKNINLTQLWCLWAKTMTIMATYS